MGHFKKQHSEVNTWVDPYQLKQKPTQNLFGKSNSSSYKLKKNPRLNRRVKSFNFEKKRQYFYLTRFIKEKHIGLPNFK